jgi:hypothetical protein
VVVTRACRGGKWAGCIHSTVWLDDWPGRSRLSVRAPCAATVQPRPLACEMAFASGGESSPSGVLVVPTLNYIRGRAVCYAPTGLPPVALTVAPPSPVLPDSILLRSTPSFCCRLDAHSVSRSSNFAPLHYLLAPARRGITGDHPDQAPARRLIGSTISTSDKQSHSRPAAYFSSASASLSGLLTPVTSCYKLFVGQNRTAGSPSTVYGVPSPFSKQPFCNHSPFCAFTANTHLHSISTRFPIR